MQGNTYKFRKTPRGIFLFLRSGWLLRPKQFQVQNGNSKKNISYILYLPCSAGHVYIALALALYSLLDPANI